jgi:hypothetical protein
MAFLRYSRYYLKVGLLLHSSGDGSGEYTTAVICSREEANKLREKLL